MVLEWEKRQWKRVTAATPENEQLVRELDCPQEEHLGTHYSLREITSELSVSKTSVNRMVKRKGFGAYKRLTTSHMTIDCKETRVERSALLAKWFFHSPLCKLVFRDEKDFPLQIPINRQNNRVYFSGSKNGITPNRLFHEDDNFTKKVMVSAVVGWNGILELFLSQRK